jgi:LysM repeat protein
MKAMNYPYPRYQRPKNADPRNPRPRAGYPSARVPQPAARRSNLLGIPVNIHSPWFLFLIVTALVSLALLPVFMLGGTYTIYMLSGHIFPGVTAGPVAAGDLPPAELAQALDMHWNRQRTLTLTDGKQTWQVTPVEVGLWVNPQATAARAFAVGRGSNAFGQLIWLIRFGKINVEPVIVYSPEAARAGLERLSAQINQPAQNATLRQENGQWVAVPGQNGSNMMIDETLRRIAANPSGVLTSGRLPLATQPVAPQISDLTPVLDRMRSALEKPLKMQAYDPISNEWQNIDISQNTLAAWVTVSQQGNDLSFGLDGQRLTAYLDEWKSSLGPTRTLEPFTPPADLAERWQNGQPVTAIIRHNPTTYTVQSGDTLTAIAYKVGMPYWKIQQANPGMNPNQLSAGQSLTIPSQNDMLPLPIVLNKRIVISISQQRLWTFENGTQTGEHVISTGIDRSPTIPGIYQVQTHDPNAYASVWDLYMPNFMGIYEGWPGFMNGIHGLPTLSSGRLLWAGYLGRPVSYGCIILGLQEAQDLYNWAQNGVVVEIQP